MRNRVKSYAERVRRQFVKRSRRRRRSYGLREAVTLEKLDPRLVLAGSFDQEQVADAVEGSSNEDSGYDYDVSQDGVISPIDALLVLNAVADGVELSSSTDDGAAYDVNQDGEVSQSDVTVVIAYVDDQVSTEADSMPGSSDEGASTDGVEASSDTTEASIGTSDSQDSGDNAGADSAGVASSGDASSDATAGDSSDPTNVTSASSSTGDSSTSGDISAGLTSGSSTASSTASTPAGAGAGGVPPGPSGPAPTGPSVGGSQTETTAACTSLGHRDRGDRWLTGSFGTAGTTVDYVMEFDHDGDGVADGEAIGQADGNWYYVPIGLQVGTNTLQQRARGWNYTDQQLVIGGWQPVEFEYLPPANDTPVISEFELQTADGERNGVTVSAYNLLVGEVSDDCEDAGVTIEFDHNQDGVPDGLTFTDAEGGFRYRPADLPLEEVTIAARPLQWDFSQEAYLVGEWEDVTFIYEEHSNEPPPISDLSAEAGPAPVVSGSINNEYSLANIDIEFDYDGDEVADATTKTTTWGEFSFGVEGLSVGEHEIDVRACELDHVGVQVLCGDWTGLDVERTELESPEIPAAPAVPSPTSPAATELLISGSAGPTLRAVAASVTADWASIPKVIKSEVDAINTTYNDTKAYLDDRYDFDLATAQAARVSSINAANDSYGASLKIADASYTAAAESARRYLLDTLFPGQASIEFEDFIWQEAPPTDTLIIPPDHEQPQAPVPPGYDGPDYDFTKDAVYQDRIKAAEDAHKSAVETAKDAFKAAEQAANDTFADALDAIESSYDAAIDAADDAYDTAIAQPSPIDLQAEEAAHNARSDTARQAYDTLVDQINAAYDALADAEVQRHDSRIAVIDGDHDARVEAARQLPEPVRPPIIAASERQHARETATENLLHAQTMAPLVKTREHDLASADEVYRNSLNASERQFNDQRTHHEHFKTERDLLARFAREAAYAAARKARDYAIAAAEQARDKAIAAAQEAKTLAVASADAALWTELADAKQAALNGWTAVATHWIDYQSALADHEATYVHARANANLTHAATTAAATRLEADTVADANKKHDDEVADADFDRAMDRAKATRDQDRGGNDLARDRALENARLWQVYQDALAESDREYRHRMADEQEIHDLSIAPDWYTATVDRGDAQADFTLSGNAHAHEVALIEIEHTLQTALSTAKQVLTDAQLVWGYGRSGHYMTDRWRHQLDVNQEERDELVQLSSLQHAHDLTFAMTDRAYVVEIVDAHTTRDDTIGAAEKTWWYTTSGADELYDNTVAAAVETHRNRDALGLRTFELHVAGDYRTLVQDWAGALPACSSTGGDSLCQSAWHQYQVALASSEFYRTGADSRAHVDYVRLAGSSERSHINSIARDDRTAAEQQADAAYQQIVSMNGALGSYKTAVADAILGHGLQTAVYRTPHDTAMATVNLALHNKESQKDRFQQAQIDQLDGQRLRDEADALKTLEHAQYDAERVQALEVATAKKELDEGSIQYDEYQRRVEAAKVVYEHTIEIAQQDYEYAKIRAFGNYEVARINLEQATANAIAAAQETATNSYGTLENKLIGDETSVDRILASVTHASTHRLADDRHPIVKQYSEDVATAINTQTKAHAIADESLARSLATSSSIYSTDLDRASSLDRQAVADALGEYHIGMHSRHEGAMAAATTGPLSVGLTSDLLQMRRSAASADVGHSNRLLGDRNSYHALLTTANATLTADTNAANLANVDATTAAEKAYTDFMADTTTGWSTVFDRALADRERDTQKADADRAQTRVGVESDYLIDWTKAQTNYDDALAASHVTWVAAIGQAEEFKFLHFEDGWPPSFQARYDTMVVVADDNASVEKALAEASFITEVGQAQLKRATGLGLADETHATKLDTAGTRYAGKVNFAEENYAYWAIFAANFRIRDISAADRTSAIDLEGVNQSFVAAQGAADTVFEFRVGNTGVARTAALADAESDYQIAWALHGPTQFHNLSATRSSPHSDLQNSIIAARRSWTLAVGPEITSFVRASARATADFQNEVASASEQRNNDQSAADVLFTTSIEPLRETWRKNDVNWEQSYPYGLAWRESTRRTALAAEFGALAQTTAEAESKESQDLAAAELYYRYELAYIAYSHEANRAMAKGTRLQAIANAESVFESMMANGGDLQPAQELYDQTVDAAEAAYDLQMSQAEATRELLTEQVQLMYNALKAQAKLDRVTRVADGDQSWVDTNAAANKAFAQDEAAQSKRLADALAAHAKTFAIGVAPHQQTHDRDYDAAQMAFWRTEQAADELWNTTVAGEQAELWQTEYRVQASSLYAAPRVVEGSDWQDYIVDLSDAKNAWWTSFRATYDSWVASVNVQNRSQTWTTTNVFNNRGRTFADEELTRTIATATAAETRAKDLAQTQYDYIAAMWSPSESGLKEQAGAERDYLIAMATIERDAAMAALSGSTVATAAAIDAANAARTTRLENTKQAYRTDEVTANGLRKIGIATVNEAFVTDVAAANLAWTGATEAAQLAYDQGITVVDQRHTRTVALLDARYWRDEARTYHEQLVADFSTLPTTPPTPIAPATAWHVFAIDENGIKVVRVDAVSAAQETREATLAMADRVHDDAASVARLGYFTDLGQAQRDRDVALAGTEVTQAKIDALKNVQLFDADAYDPMRPLFPVKPEQYPWAVDEVLAEDYEVREWSVAGGYDPVKKLFKHPTPSEREEFVIPEWLRPYTGNRVHDEFARQTDSWAGYVLAVADGNGGIYIDNQNGQQQTDQNQNGPSGNRPQVEDPVLRVNLRTPDIVHDFHTYFRDYARLGGSVSKDAADMWIHFEAIGLSDSRAFSAYGHPSTDAMLHFYENVRPLVVTSDSQDDTGVGDGEADLGDNSSDSEELSNTESPSDIAFVIEATLPNLRWNDEGIETKRLLDISNPSDLHDLVLELGHRHNVYERQLALAERRLTRYSHVLAHGPLPPLGRPDYDSIDRQILGLGGPHMRKKAQEQWELYQQIKLLRRALDEIEQLFVVGGLNKVDIYVRNVNEREDLPHTVEGTCLEQAKLAATVLMARVPGLGEAMSPLDLIIPGKIAVRGVPLLFRVFRAGTGGVIRRAVTKITPSRATTAELFKTTRNAVSKLLSREAPNSEVYSLALGLSRHPNHTRSGLLMRFADKVDDTNVRHYWQLIDEMGLPNAAVGRQLEGQLLDFMKNSKHIHLNLDGILDTLDSAKLKEILKLGEQGTRVPQNITRWEFLQVWSKFRDKATFYFDGEAVDLTDLLK